MNGNGKVVDKKNCFYIKTNNGKGAKIISYIIFRNYETSRSYQWLFNIIYCSAVSYQLSIYKYEEIAENKNQFQ